MPLNPLNHHYAMENPASVYDEEAMTALELAGRTTAKVNETVKAFNELETETNTHLAEQDKELSDRLTAQDNRLPGLVNDKVQDHINKGDFDRQIDTYAGQLENRLDLLLGSVVEGDTTMDAEVIDIRSGADGVVYTSAGEAVRAQYSKTSRTIKTYRLHRNLIDPGKVRVGYYQTCAGAEGENATYCVTGKIRVIPGEQIFCWKPVRYLCAFDASGNAVADAGKENLSIYTAYTVPDGIHSIVYTAYADGASELGANVGVAPLSMIHQAIPNSIYKEEIAIDGAYIEHFNKITRPSNNLADPEMFVEGVYMWDSKTLMPNATYSSFLVPVNEGDKLAMSVNINFCSEIDSTGAFIGTTRDVTKYTATVTGWVCLSLRHDAVGNLMVNYGDTVLPYEIGGRVIDPDALPLDESGLDTTKAIYLPQKIQVCVGATLELYNGNVCNVADKYHFKWSCDVGEPSARKYTIAGTSGAIGEHQLTCTIMDDSGHIVWSGGCTVEIVPAMSAPKKIVAIGDSWTNSKAWLAEVMNLSGGKVSFIGHYPFTLTDSSGNRCTGSHEGRSGFHASNYVNGDPYTYGGGNETTHNVFWNPNTEKFDWAYYVENTLDDVAPDAVSILLGINSVSEDNTTPVTAEKEMVDSILATHPNMPIVICIPAFPGKGNKAGWIDSFTYSRYVLDLARKLETAFINYSNVTICPVCTLFDSEYNYPAVSKPVNPRSSIMESVETDTIHASTEGYYSLADIIYSALCKAVN